MKRSAGWVLAFAIVGNVVPGGMFFYALIRELPSLRAAFSDTLAMAFLLDLVLTMGFLGYLFARKVVGPLKWPWLVAFTLLGTLAFGLPLFLWINWWRLPKPRPDFVTWWREA